MSRNRQTIDTRALGLDLAVRFAKFLTGRQNLHYGYWEEDVDVCAANLGQAQDVYTRKLLAMLPPGRHHILDIGGGAGETGRLLADHGHDVAIVVPSAFLAECCRAHGQPNLEIHETRFEDFRPTGRYDVCIFSESLQYIDLDIALDRAIACLRPGGWLLIADCFRDEEGLIREASEDGVVGSGHGVSRFRAALAARSLQIESEEDVTDRVAPSIDLEREFYTLIGGALRRVDDELTRIYPTRRRMLATVLRNAVSERRRVKFFARLDGHARNAATFCRCNRYLMLRLRTP